MERFDLIVLGAGSGARDGANKAARDYGARVALVESTRWGGSCPNVACKPTKAYLVAAELAHDIATLAGRLGVETSAPRVDLAAVKARKDSLIVGHDTWMERLHGAGHATFEGHGAFVDPHTIQVNGTRLSAERILIATGSRTAEPPIHGLGNVGWIDHVSALELTELPRSLLVVGGGPVGLELAQIFHRFGSRVTIAQGADRISPRSDPDATEELTAALRDEGIDIRTGARVTAVRRNGHGIVASIDEDELLVETILLASGRVPNVERLDLERAGIEHTRAGVLVDEHMRTSVAGVWGAGDVTGSHQFTPVAQYEARIAVDDMFGTTARADYSHLPTAIFTDPELAAVGLTEREARAAGHAVEAAIHPIAHVQRASYTDTRRGLYKVVWDRESRRILGLHVVCRNASDIVQGLAVAMRLGLSVDDVAHMHHAFPTYGEGVKAAAEQALRA